MFHAKTWFSLSDKNCARKTSMNHRNRGFFLNTYNFQLDEEIDTVHTTRYFFEFYLPDILVVCDKKCFFVE